MHGKESTCQFNYINPVKGVNMQKEFQVFPKVVTAAPRINVNLMMSSKCKKN